MSDVGFWGSPRSAKISSMSREKLNHILKRIIVTWTSEIICELFRRKET